MNATTTDPVVTLRDSRVGRLRLNRPKALNALTLDMVRTITAALVDWAKDAAVDIVLLDHLDGRGFCAGGDVVTVVKSIGEGGAAADAFFAEEYQMNHLMHSYPKTGVVFMDGVTMGGGVGISCPWPYRVATERTMFSMPETGIGLFPDVGAGHYLAKLRGRVAQFLALTGARLDGAECMALGLATHYIASERLDMVKADLIERPRDAAAILGEAAQAPPPARIVGNFETIDRLFASDRLEDIVGALESDGSEWAAKELGTIRAQSPFSGKVSLRQLVESRHNATFEDEMRMEFAMVTRMVRHHDFAEGVRALLIDKDNAPDWQPKTPDAVDDASVEALFRPLAADKQWRPLTL